MEEERVAEQKALDGALARLSRWREEMTRNPDPPPNMMRQPVRHAQVSGELLRVRVEDVPLMPTSVPAELAHWMDDCQAQLQAALSQGDDVAVLQFSAKMTQGAERMLQMKRVVEVREDELAVRSAPGEGRFAPYRVPPGLWLTDVGSKVAVLEKGTTLVLAAGVAGRRDCGRSNGPWTVTQNQKMMVGTLPGELILKCQ